ncbi:MAG: GspE/PulE family protein [Puniceicoccaceae bacterium]
MALSRTQLQIVKKLEELKHLSGEQVAEMQSSKEGYQGDEFDRFLIEQYRINHFDLIVGKSLALKIMPFNARRYFIGERAFEILDKDFCESKMVLPLGVVGNYLAVAMHNPFDVELIDSIRSASGMKVEVLLTPKDDLVSILEAKPDTIGSGDFGDVVDQIDAAMGIEDIEIDETADEEAAPIIQLANRIIEDAYYSGGSDIHIEPFEDETRVRVRVDGICSTKLVLPNRATRALVARLKVMAQLDIAERRLPQDGRIIFRQFSRKGIDIDLRVATAPLNHGEGMVMRILDKQKSTLPLPALGFSVENLETYRKLIRRPYGMILHCGPTGSGKSMTLYSALNEINDPEVCIRTAEDPIEYTLHGICQMQMNKKIGLSFANALRAFLRQDPDIILVGEIRDHETAQIAIEAALTGHMLFSTLHTNDAPSSISRLTEMEIEPFMISASLVCICAQRLMRRVCKNCRVPYEPEGNEKEIIEKAIQWSGQIYRASDKGCPVCGGKGYKGRVGIHELMAVSEELIKGINARLESVRLKAIAKANGMKTLHQDSMLKIKDGVSTMGEALGTVPPDMEKDSMLELAKAELEEALV